MADMLRWPYRAVLYVMLYMVWTIISLVIFTVIPGLSYYQTIIILPLGWIPIGVAFFLDVYYKQLGGRKRQESTAANA
jgi:hypothetical protein